MFAGDKFLCHAKRDIVHQQIGKMVVLRCISKSSLVLGHRNTNNHVGILLRKKPLHSLEQDICFAHSEFPSCDVVKQAREDDLISCVFEKEVF